MKLPQEIPVLVDHRERNSVLLQALEDHPLFCPETVYLPEGDYRIGEEMLVERKTCVDFSLSIIQGRLFRQAIRLSAAVKDRKIEAAVIIIEGQEDEFHKIDINREAVLGAMASLSLKFQLPVFRTLAPLESVKMMDYIYHQIDMEVDQHHRTFPVRWGKFSKGTRKRKQIYILQGLPGVGAARAADLLDHFGSVGSVFAASDKDLCDVKGIGKGIAKEIRKIIEP